MGKKDKQDRPAESGGRIKGNAPDRAAIIKCLDQQGSPLKRRELADLLKVHEAGPAEILRRRLRAMVRDGQLIKNRRGAYGVAARMDLVSGRVSAHVDGFGFVIPDAGGDDLYLSPRQMRGVLHGDRVLASIIGVDHRGRREGRVKKVLEHANQTVVGRFVQESGVALVVPDDPKITQDVMVPLKDTGDAQPGQVVVAAIVTPPSDRQPPIGKIVEILGAEGDPGMATDIAIHSHGLPFEWPKAAARQAASIGKAVPESMKAGRKDLRDLPLVTIDGADARDFDDAVHARRNRNGWRLVVAIADVASYVAPGSALDDEAQHRATSVYFPNRVVPMLPESLSNGLCSLKPDEDRLCLACDMTVDDNGTVTRSRFVAAVMRSHARLTYREVWRYLDQGQLAERHDRAEIRRNLDDLGALYKVLSVARKRRGAIDFETQEVSIRFDAEGHVSDIVPVVRNDAHKLIEECMILANVEAARFLGNIRLPAPYRVHAPPPQLKLEALMEFLRAQGLAVRWKDSPSPRELADVAQRAHGHPAEKLIMAVLLRSQSLAVYQAENKGHFGLALDAYAHFTSPIRRYPDLLVHRAIHHQLARRQKRDFTYDRAAMDRLCEICSHRARRAEEAERDVSTRLKCIYMQDHIGQVFSGTVAGVTSFGLFVELDLGNVNGLLHVTGLPNDYYHFDPVRHSLKGERRGRTFQLADRVQVSVREVNVQERKIDFDWHEPED